MATNLKMCPSCNTRSLAPFLGPKRRCKNCGMYVDVLDLMFAEAGGPAAAPPAASPALPVSSVPVETTP